MTAVLVQPSGGTEAKEHYETSIRKKVRFSEHLNVLTSAELKSLNSDFGDGQAAMWGLVPGDNGINISRWDSINPGDMVVFSGKKKMFAMGIVVSKFRNAQLAKQLWGKDSKGQTWEYMYTLSDVRETDVSYTDFNSAVGDNPKNNHMGFRILNAEKSARFVEFLEGNGGIFRNAVSSITELTYDDILAVINEWGNQPQDSFLRIHGLNQAQKYVIVENGKKFDAKAVVDLALRRKFPDLTGITYDGNENTIARPLRRLGFIVRDKDQTGNRYWWVNQNKTHEEFFDGYMWSPLSKRDGTSNPYYEFMSETQPGDCVISYWDKRVQGFGIVAKPPKVTPKPFYRTRETWSERGWLVDVNFTSFDNPFEPREHMNEIRQLLPSKHSPLNVDGKGRELYLTEISRELYSLLCNKGELSFQDLLGQGLVKAYSEKETQVILRDFVPRQPKKPKSKSKPGKSATSPRYSKKSDIVGKFGEKIVFENEKQKLIDTGKPKFAAKVNWHRDDATNRTPGWDITSYDLNGHKIFIEVKASEGKTINDVELTIKEWTEARKCIENDKYFIYLVTNVFSKKPKIERIKNPAKLVDKKILNLKIIRYQLRL